MAMGRKEPEQSTLWVPHRSLARAPGHRFYEKLNELLGEHAFDAFVEDLCEPYFASSRKQGRRSIPPGVYFRMLLVGYFEGIESERGICWRCEDSLSLRSFLGLGVDGTVPDHSSLSRTRTRYDSEVYEEVFRFVLSMVEQAGLLKGRVVGVDSTYLRADASMKAIVRRDTDEAYDAYLLRLAKESGIENPSAEDARRMDRARKKKTSNQDWRSPTDPDARIARLKDGRTKLAHKAELTNDLETGAILAAVVHPADQDDRKTISDSLDVAATNMEVVAEAAVAACDDRRADASDDQDDPPPTTGSTGDEEPAAPPIDVVADKGYYSAAVLEELESRGYRTYIPEPKYSKPRRWSNKVNGEQMRKRAARARRRTKSKRGKAMQRRRGELLERPFAHLLETGAHRRTRLRGRQNIQKRFSLHAAAANLGLIMRTLFGVGTPRRWADALRAALRLLYAVYVALQLPSVGGTVLRVLVDHLTLTGCPADRPPWTRWPSLKAGLTSTDC
jgi:transposase